MKGTWGNRSLIFPKFMFCYVQFNSKAAMLFSLMLFSKKTRKKYMGLFKEIEIACTNISGIPKHCTEGLKFDMFQNMY